VSDRTAHRWLLPPAALLAGLGLALTGLAPNYPTILALVVVSGLGVAAFHPEGYKTAARVAGDWKATGVSWFSVGGNIGIAVGAPVITLLVAGFGLPGSLGMLVPSLLAGALLLRAQAALSAPVAGRKASAVAADRGGPVGGLGRRPRPFADLSSP
jgi:FSR family fosmidomycin resistance protein-like MFS transporter